MIYRGRKIPNFDAEVRKDDGTELDPRYDLAGHSPDGFNWGYNGSGSAQLALALLADTFAEEKDDGLLVMGFYQDFKEQVVSGWGDIWTITFDEIMTWHQEEIESRRLQIPRQTGTMGRRVNV